MKKFTSYLFFAVLAITLMQACGKQKQSKVQGNAANPTVSKAEQDSIKAQAEREAMLAAKSVQQQTKSKNEKNGSKQPGNTQPTKQSQANQAQTGQPQKTEIVFDANGKYAIQISSWRSIKYAAQRKKIWENRGYKDAYIVKYGNEATGNIWFRVRLGRFDTKAMAISEQKKIEQKYHLPSWVSNVSGMIHSK